MDKVLDMISIHALREESDQQVHKSKWQPRWFQSTLSARRATGYMPYSSDKTIISIHALREESDVTLLSVETALFLISIHALREESDKAAKKITDRNIKISIHALREESDANTG